MSLLVCVCVFFSCVMFKKAPFFHQILSTALGGLSVPHIPCTSKTTLSLRTPWDFFFKWQLRARDIRTNVHTYNVHVRMYVCIYVCTYVYFFHTPKSSKSWCFFSLTSGRWESTMRSTPLYITIRKIDSVYPSVCVLCVYVCMCVILGWGFLGGGCTCSAVGTCTCAFLKQYNRACPCRPQSYQQLTTTII